MPDGTPQPAALISVVDTEEEFDWSAPFDRASTSVVHMRSIGRLQAVFETWGIRPVYVATYPVVSQPEGIAALGPLVRNRRALLGAHLHPWVTPPFDEEVNERYSFPGNLPEELERAKLIALTQAITANFGIRPKIYKAGRYGIGPRSFAILQDLGFSVDVSPAPPFDYSPHHGPDFSRRGLQAEWSGPAGRVLSVPGTGALIGRLPYPGLYRLAAGKRLAILRLGAILSRFGVVECLRLSPEGYRACDMQRLVRWLHARGERLFVLTLHSPSVEPGHTPYVRTAAQADAFLAELNDFLRFFMVDLAGRPTDLLEFRAAAERRRH
jgi:hypothetical protein